MLDISFEPALPEIWKDKTLSCPFCGESKRLFVNKIGHLYHIECHSCGARGSRVTSDNPALPIEALNAWNNAPRGTSISFTEYKPTPIYGRDTITGDKDD